MLGQDEGQIWGYTLEIPLTELVNELDEGFERNTGIEDNL